MATLSMVSVPIAPSSLSLSTRGRSSSASFPAPKVSAIFSRHPRPSLPVATARPCSPRHDRLCVLAFVRVRALETLTLYLERKGLMR